MMQCWQTIELMPVGQAGKNTFYLKRKNIFSAQNKFWIIEPN